MSKKINPFDIFAINNRTEFIKALNTEVTFRPLTKKESDEFNTKLLGDYSGEGEVNIDLKLANKINMQKVANCLIEPKITIEEMNAYGSGINDAINEIVGYIDNRKNEDDDEEGTDAGN